MSTGLGRVQRCILDALDGTPQGVLVVPDGASPATANSFRRAAHTLARRGRLRVALIYDGGRRRLAAFSP